MIASFFDGRVRIRHSALKDPANMRRVEEAIKAQNGVRSAAANLRTGGLLVEYDPALISRETLSIAAKALREQLEEKRPEGPDSPGAAKRAAASCGRLLGRFDGRSGRRLARFRPGRKAENAALASLFALTLAGGFLNSRLHVGAGVLLTLLTARHMYRRRRYMG